MRYGSILLVTSPSLRAARSPARRRRRRCGWGLGGWGATGVACGVPPPLDRPRDGPRRKENAEGVMHDAVGKHETSRRRDQFLLACTHVLCTGVPSAQAGVCIFLTAAPVPVSVSSSVFESWSGREGGVRAREKARSRQAERERQREKGRERERQRERRAGAGEGSPPPWGCGSDPASRMTAWGGSAPPASQRRRARASGRTGSVRRVRPHTHTSRVSWLNCRFARAAVC